MNGRFTLQDLAACVVSVVLVCGCVVLAALGDQIPSEVSTAMGASITWLFVRSVQEAAHNAPDRSEP